MGDVMTLLALVILACRPILPLPVLGAAGALLVISCFRPIGAERPLSRAARALVGAVMLYPAIAGAWTVWPAYLLVPLLVTLAIGFLQVSDAISSRRCSGGTSIAPNGCGSPSSRFLRRRP
jgi:hypothetical protein